MRGQKITNGFRLLTGGPIGRRCIQKANFLLLAALLLFWNLGCRRSGSENQNQGTIQKSTPKAGEEVYFKTPFQDESQYIVESILSDVVEMACFAKLQTLAPDISVQAVESAKSDLDKPSYEVTIKLPQKTIHSKLKVDHPIWAAEVYTGMGREIFDALELKSGPPIPAGPDDERFVKNLLDLTAVNLENQDQQLSAALQTNFSNPMLHQRAAMLLGAFALRETPDWFSDVRAPLCRQTAHLAMAQLLSTGASYGASGQIAEAMSYALMGNEVDGVARARSLDTNQPEIAAWSRVLYARNTRDYRELRKVAKRSPAESIEYFRACCTCLDPTRAWEELPDILKTNCTDTMRMLSTTERSIELGHVVWHGLLPLEMKEFTLVFAKTGHRAADEKELLASLNDLPARCLAGGPGGTPKVQVIGWGQWAASIQAHLCNAISDTFDFLQYRYGAPETAEEYITNLNAHLSGLTLYPFVLRANCTNEATYKAAIDRCYPATQAAPHLFSAHSWNLICFPVDFAEFYQPFPDPHINDWFKHNPPPGTAYNLLWRRSQPNITERPDVMAHFERLHEIAPYSWAAVGALIRLKYKGAPTFEQEEELLRPVLDYHAGMLSRLAEDFENRSADYEKMMLKVAQSIPSAYLSLGHYANDRGDDAKAMEYLEKGMDWDLGAVGSSAFAGELMRLYVKHGKKVAAEVLVDKAADTYSSAGFKAKADFLEMEGDYAGARKCYEEIEDRYGRNNETLAFMLRVKARTGSTMFDVDMSEWVTSIFPDGIEKVTLASFTKPPEDGVVVGEENAETAKVKLNQGAIIVALNGIRVHTFEQYQYARNSKRNSPLDLIVWQDGKYRQLTANPPNGKFEVPMPDYHRAK